MIFYLEISIVKCNKKNGKNSRRNYHMMVLIFIQVYIIYDHIGFM